MDICTIASKYRSLIIDSGQKPTLGLQSFAEYFRRLSGCVYVTDEKQFYIYNPDNGGTPPYPEYAGHHSTLSFRLSFLPP